MDRRLHVEEHEQVAQIKCLLENVAPRQQDVLNYISSATERSREEGERADGDVATHGANEDDNVGSVVADRPNDGQRSADYSATNRESAILLIETLRKLAIPVGQPGSQTEHLHFLRGLVARTDVTQVIQLAAFRRPAEQQRVTE